MIGDGAVRLTPLWQSWEQWFTDVEETHTTFAVLPFFRSPQPEQSWITAAGTLLDAASMWVAAVEHSADPDAQLCIRTGFQALRRIAASYGLDIDPDPQPMDPISIGRSEWDQDVAEMAKPGRPDRRGQRGGLGGLAGLAGQLRRRAAHAGPPRRGAARAVGLGPQPDRARTETQTGRQAAPCGPASVGCGTSFSAE